MNPVQRLQVQQSEIREELAGLLANEEPTEEQLEELRGLTTRAQNVEVALRAALVAQPEPVDVPTDPPPPEEREELELRDRFSVGRVLAACLRGRAVDGAEAELQAERGISATQIPIEVFERREAPPAGETRAVTTLPTSGTEANLAMRPIVPAVFERSVAGFLGVEMPSVPTGDAGFPILSTSVTATPKAYSANAPETAGAYTIKTAEPRRITGAFRFRLEDAARLAGLEASLRRNLTDVLSDQLDEQLLNGTASGDGTVHGLLAQLADPSASSPASGNPTVASYLAPLADAIEGKLANTEMDVAVLVGTATYTKMATMFISDSNETFSGFVNRNYRGVRAAARIAAPASKKQAAVLIRRPMEVPNAVMPTWGQVDVRDMYSAAAAGEIVVTTAALVGDVVILRPTGYEQVDFRQEA